MLLTEGFAQSEAFFVQALQLVGILFDTSHFQWPQGTYAGYLARSLQVVYQLYLLIICLMTMTQRHTQTRIVLI